MEAKKGCVSMSLAPELEAGREIEAIMQKAACASSHIIISLNNVDMLTRQSLTGLLRIQGILRTYRRRLILCDVNSLVEGIFSVLGYAGLFEIAENQTKAFELLEPVSV